MPSRPHPDQLGLFAEPDPASLRSPEGEAPAMPPGFLRGVREELLATLGTVRGARRLPWPDPTRAMLAELRFEAMSRWLPAEEGEGLRAAFLREVERLEAAAGEAP